MEECGVIDERTIREAARLLCQAAPGAKVVLFGSYARGQGHPDSDLDFLVVEPEVESRIEEMIRLRDVLRPLRVPAEVLVVSREQYERWSHWPGNVYHEAATNGRAFDAVA